MDDWLCAHCGAEFLELGMLPDERFLACDGSMTCSVDCCHEHNMDVMDARECAVSEFFQGLSR